MRTFCDDNANEEAYVGASNCKMNDSNRLFRNDTIIVLGVLSVARCAVAVFNVVVGELKINNISNFLPRD